VLICAYHFLISENYRLKSTQQTPNIWKLNQSHSIKQTPTNSQMKQQHGYHHVSDSPIWPTACHRQFNLACASLVNQTLVMKLQTACTSLINQNLVITWADRQQSTIVWNNLTDWCHATRKKRQSYQIKQDQLVQTKPPLPLLNLDSFNQSFQLKCSFCQPAIVQTKPPINFNLESFQLKCSFCQPAIIQTKPPITEPGLHQSIIWKNKLNSLIC
jgi:hypothetical protein